MKHRLFFVIILLLGSSLDIWSKGWAFDLVAENLGPVSVVEGVFYIDRAENPGAMWSLFRTTPRHFWVAIRGGVFLLLLVFYFNSRPVKTWEHLGFALVMAGAVGNVYDNIFSPGGRVRDWIRVHFLWWDPWPLFNLADSMVFCGAPLLLWHFHVAEKRARAAREGEERAAGAAKSEVSA